MELTYRKLLLSTMHMVTCTEGDPSGITDETLLQALTVNENLHALGFTLRPQEIGKLAASPSMTGFYQSVKELVPEIKAEPMYPDFPIQVMEMDEAQFRFHQMMHYFSTYGQMMLTGLPVSKGWLPDVESTPKTEADDRLLQDTVLELVTEEESYPLCLRRLLERRERLTIPERELAVLALPHVSEETLSGIRVPFKENLELLFPAVFEKFTGEKLTGEKPAGKKHAEEKPAGEKHAGGELAGEKLTGGKLTGEKLAGNRISGEEMPGNTISGKEAVRILKHLCQHTGDVLNNAHLLLKKHRYHFRTSEKRTLVRLLESYPAADFRGNLILSNARRERNLLVLRHLDYSVYSRSAAHKKAVGDLRRGQLHSWEGTAKRMLLSHEEGALAFVAKRPGVMLRMLQWILSLGYGEEEIAELLCAHAREFSTQMLVKLLSSARIESKEGILREKDSAMGRIHERYSQLRWQYVNVESMRVNEVCRENVNYNRQKECLERELARKLHELSERVITKKCAQEIESRRNAIMDKIDGMHMAQKKHRQITEMEKSLSEMEKRILFLTRTVRAWQGGPEGTYLRAENAARLLRRLESDRDKMQEAKQALQSEIDAVVQRELELFSWEEKRAQILQKYEALRKSAPEKSAALRDEYARRQKELLVGHEERLVRIEKEFAKKAAAAPAALAALAEREAAEIAKAPEMYERRLRALRSIPARKRILERILKAHLACIQTPLRGRKVFLDPGPFDLAHSLMLTTDKSQDGTYIRSGFAWKIPDDAKRVRFFVYWNDREQVDIDLHASAAATTAIPDELYWFHVGWNSKYKERGVVFSGDITHSDAAEYIDIDLNAPLRYVTMNIDLYWGQESFHDIDECFTGLMAVRKFKQKVSLYDPANCFFTHELRQDVRFMTYGYIDVQERFVRFVGKPQQRCFNSHIETDPANTFYVSEYLDILLAAQGATLVDSPSLADEVLTVGKSAQPGAISLVDHNFFLDADAQPAG